jgi:mono/diheme cytochrome c family protein
MLGDLLMARTTKRSARVLALMAMCVLAFAVAGCGSSKSSTATDPKQIFAETCGGCHTLASAGTDGDSGPNLDELSPTAGEVEKQVQTGGGGMPSFDGDLTAAQITAVSEFVASTAGQ